MRNRLGIDIDRFVQIYDVYVIKLQVVNEFAIRKEYILVWRDLDLDTLRCKTCLYSVTCVIFVFVPFSK